jgi:hypothetical protein
LFEEQTSTPLATQENTVSVECSETAWQSLHLLPGVLSLLQTPFVSTPLHTTFNRHKARPLFEEQTSTPLATQENTEDKQEEMDVLSC